MRDMAFELAPVLAILLVLSQPFTAQERPGPGAKAKELAAAADAARLANRGAEAIELYRKALASEPAWAEGWWRLGTLLYDSDAHAEAADALRKAVELEPNAGTAWVMLGLSEFHLGRADAALEAIQRGRTLGTSPDPQFRHVMLYHEGLLLLGKAEFERAQETLGQLGAEGVESDELTRALGLSVLRLRPSDVGEGASVANQLIHQLIHRAGRAELFAARKQFDNALREYERLPQDFPTARNVHYALGRYFVATQEPDKAVAAFEREIAQSPDHVPARLGIAAIKAGTDPAGALPHAEEAVRLNPRIPLGHYLLGSLLLHTDQIDRAISELELAEREVTEDPGVYYALGRAYARAGRAEDAERVRAIFRRLTEERQRAARKVPDGTAQPAIRPPPR